MSEVGEMNTITYRCLLMATLVICGCQRDGIQVEKKSQFQNKANQILKRMAYGVSDARRGVTSSSRGLISSSDNQPVGGVFIRRAMEQEARECLSYVKYQEIGLSI